jgi:hypothetical protein
MSEYAPFPPYAKERRKLIGKTIEYLMIYDTDYKIGTLQEVDGRAIEIDDVWYFGSNVREYKVVGE